MPEYTYINCLDTNAQFGEEITCGTGTQVEGICGSGRREDCGDGAYSHSVGRHTVASAWCESDSHTNLGHEM